MGSDNEQAGSLTIRSTFAIHIELTSRAGPIRGADSPRKTLRGLRDRPFCCWEFRERNDDDDGYNARPLSAQLDHGFHGH